MTIKAALDAKPRSETGKGAARRLRASGRVPAVVYGNEMDTVSISVDAAEATHLFQSISVENTIVDLQVDGDDAPLRSLVREVQTHAYRPDILHIDFYRIQEGVAIEVEIPVRLLGVPEGVKNSGGVLEQIIHDLSVKCIPSKIPEVVEIDVTGLDMGDAVHVSDLDLGEGVEVLIDPSQTVCTVVAPKVLASDEEEEEAEELEVELIGAELEEGEEAEGTEAGEDEEPEA